VLQFITAQVDGKPTLPNILSKNASGTSMIHLM